MLLKPAPFVLHVRLSDLGLVRTKGLEFWTLGLTVFNPFYLKTVLIFLMFGYECLIPMVFEGISTLVPGQMAGPGPGSS